MLRSHEYIYRSKYYGNDHNQILYPAKGRFPLNKCGKNAQNQQQNATFYHLNGRKSLSKIPMCLILHRKPRSIAIKVVDFSRWKNAHKKTQNNKKYHRRQ